MVGDKVVGVWGLVVVGVQGAVGWGGHLSVEGFGI